MFAVLGRSDIFQLTFLLPQMWTSFDLFLGEKKVHV